jgi:hypothetical protein
MLSIGNGIGKTRFRQHAATDPYDTVTLASRRVLYVGDLTGIVSKHFWEVALIRYPWSTLKRWIEW